MRFPCREGHSYTGKTLLAALGDGFEASLWAAVQTMEERVRMLERLAATDRQQGRQRSAVAFQAKADEAKKHGDRLREFLLTLNQQ